MALDGDIRVFRWPGARSVIAANHESVRFDTSLLQSIALPHGRGINRAEAICDVPPGALGGSPRWLVCYDAPGEDRRDGERVVFADLLQEG